MLYIAFSLSELKDKIWFSSLIYIRFIIHFDRMIGWKMDYKLGNEMVGEESKSLGSSSEATIAQENR